MSSNQHIIMFDIKHNTKNMYQIFSFFKNWIQSMQIVFRIMINLIFKKKKKRKLV